MTRPHACFGSALCKAALVLFAGLAAPQAQANDGFGGLSATGLTFGQTDAIAMEEEDLFIGFDEIRVAYVFRNLTDRDVTGEVIFPLPPIPLNVLMMSEFNLPQDRSEPDLINFRATVDGQDVPVTLDQIAVIEPSWTEERPASAFYDTPGTDVTAQLARFGLPVTVDVDQVRAALAALPPSRLKDLVATGLVEAFTEGPPQTVDDVMPLWSVVSRYHWTQTFPAGQVLRVAHRYDNRPPGGIFPWQDPPREDWLQVTVARYCVDPATSKGIARRLAASEQDGMLTGMSWNISYVLRTANSWAGPIGRFHLTIDKGSERHILSLCAEGLKKTGPTTFELERRNFTPERDLEILIVSPLEG